MDSLLVLTECRSALAEAKTLEDVLAIRDKAELVRRLLKIQGESLAAQNEMAEITTLAEIKLGKSLAQMDKAKGSKGIGKKARLQTETTLADIGVSKVNSHRWQTMAAAERLVPKLVREATENGKDFTRAMVYREGQRIRKGDEPKRHGKESWGPGEWISHLRKRVESVYEEAPQDFRGIMANVLRSLAENVEAWESQDDGASRRNREAAAVA